MKTIIMLAAILGLSACAATGNAIAENGNGSMKQYSSIEHLRCPKSRYPSVKKRLECKHNVRAELNAKDTKREAGQDESD